MPHADDAPSPLDRAMGSSIRILRQRCGLSQTALGEACGVSFQQIQKYENGTNRVPFSRLVQLARALQCRVRDLVGVLDEPEVADTTDAATLQALTQPGAAELLTRFFDLPEGRRAGLLALLADPPPAATET